MVNHTLPKTRRLLRPAEFRQVFDRKCSAADGVLIAYGLGNGLDHARLGLVVSRKVGNAVRRNRWKRRIREVFRLVQAELPTGLDLVVLPRGGAQPDFGKIHQSLPVLARRVAGKLAKEN
jgi:ribonuclease P protein component